MANHSHTGPKEAFTKIENLEHRAESFLHDIASKSGKISAEMQEYGDATAQYIRRHPVRSTLIAGLAGIIIGKLLSK